MSFRSLIFQWDIKFVEIGWKLLNLLFHHTEPGSQWSKVMRNRLRLKCRHYYCFSLRAFQVIVTINREKKNKPNEKENSPKIIWYLACRAMCRIMCRSMGMDLNLHNPEVSFFLFLTSLRKARKSIGRTRTVYPASSLIPQGGDKGSTKQVDLGKEWKGQQKNE